jgi:hypothetical protein
MSPNVQMRSQQAGLSISLLPLSFRDEYLGISPKSEQE